MGFSISGGFLEDRSVFFSQLDHASTSAQSTEATSGALQHNIQKQKKEIQCSPDMWNR